MCRVYFRIPTVLVTDIKAVRLELYRTCSWGLGGKHTERTHTIHRAVSRLHVRRAALWWIIGLPRSRDVDLDLDHLYGVVRSVFGNCTCGHLRNRYHGLEALNDLAEDWVCRRTWRKPVKSRIIDDVDEELASASIGTSICHAQRSRHVADLCGMLVRYRSLQLLCDGADDCLSGTDDFEAAIRLWATCTWHSTTFAAEITGVWAAELRHKVGDHAMEMEAIIVCGAEESVDPQTYW